MAPPSEHDPVVRMQDVAFRYPAGRFELCLGALSVARGEHVAIVGASGSGKTTLLHLAAGIVVPQRGCVRTQGIELSGEGDATRRDFRATHIGYVFQGFELLDYLDVLDNILLPYRVSPALRLDAEVRSRAVALGRRLGIGDMLGRLPGQLSRGEQQRAAVCRALVTRPALVMADEPTGSLDAANKHRVVEMLHEQARESGAALVAVTHDQDLLAGFDRVIDLEELRT